MRNDTPIFNAMLKEMTDKVSAHRSRPPTMWQQVKSYVRFLWNGKA